MAADLARFDPADPAVFADPYPEFARLRAAGPLARGFGGQWVLSRHAEISAVLRDKRLTKHLPPESYEALVGAGPSSAFLGRLQDLVEDRRVTRALSRAYQPKFTPWLAGYAHKTAAALLDGAARDGHFDAVADVGVPLPVALVCELFGIPDRDREAFRVRVADMVVAYNDSVVAAEPETIAARRAAADGAVRWLQEYLRDFVAHRQAHPADDAVTALLTGDAEIGALTADTVVDCVIISCYAGFETAMAMITTGLAALAGQPAQWDRLRADPDLIPTAVEEFVRYDAPIQIGVRRVLEPFVIDGQKLRPGRLLVLLLGSANRDERVFTDPDRLDVGRSPNPHLAFGGGAYYCLGAALARLEGAAVLAAMRNRFARLEPAAPPVRRARFNFRSYSSVPLAVTPG